MNPSVLIRHGRPLAVLAVLALLAGCTNSVTVSGEVTYEGQPVEQGEILFQPADGKGATAGGRITNGSYSVTGLTPGPKVVQITAVKKVPFARSTEEMAKMAATAKAKGNATGIIDPADTIPASAVGNNTTVEVQPGSQTLNFPLKKPAKAR